MTVSRLIYYVHEDQKVLRCRAIILTRVFVWLDVLCFLVQAAGGLMLSADDAKTLDIGMDIYIAGIAFQQAVIAVFFVLTAQFYRELGVKGRADRPLRLTRWLLVVLLVNFALITVSWHFTIIYLLPLERVRGLTFVQDTHHLPPGRVDSRRQRRQPAPHERDLRLLPRRAPRSPRAHTS